ncbi:MAG: hypothetical protein AUG43_00840 [Actinobacteria bacterium 13_1_20CM_3_68_10]|nr:MAG: hypothetical protein AUG43_00840 [Actinobacteria bacterium 13_1_20CM_3_68_10]
MRRNRFPARKLLLSIAVLGSAASIAGVGTFATFTSSTSTSHTIASGTLSLTAPVNRLGTGASPIAAGDTMQRAIDLSYSGTISFGSATLTTSATSSSLLDTDATNSVVASRALIGSSIALSNLTLAAGSTDHLRVTVTLPSSADNTLENKSSTIDYTFTGVQRAGANQ